MAAGHILRVTERRPFVHGRSSRSTPTAPCRAAASGKPAWVTSEAARAQGHLMRARADAILVGRRTVIDDDPLLTCRLPGLEDRSPVRIVLARELAGSSARRLAQTAHAASAVGVLRRRVRTPRRSTPRARDILPCRRDRRRALAARRDGDAGRARHHAAAGRGRPGDLARVLARRPHRRGGAVPRARPTGAALSPAAGADVRSARYIATDGFALYDRRTIGSDDMLAFRRHWHRARRARGEQTH